MQKHSKLIPTLAVFVFIAGLLAMVQWKVERPMLLAERFIPGSGWIELLLIAGYGAFLMHKMQDASKSAKWRLRSWTLFSIVFFSQLILGIIHDNRFLMTGKLHLPIPAMMLAGPIYRGEISFMTILFLSTIVLTGPAWCSQLCYFGALDGIAASRKKPRKGINNILQLKAFLLILCIAIILGFKLLGISTEASALAGIAFGLGGVLVLFTASRKQGNMSHCLVYCPIGTLVTYLKWINPIRVKIASDCTTCGRCTTSCRYDALTTIHLKQKKVGLNCTHCGDCITSCPSSSIQYKLGKLSPQVSRNVYLFLSISVHAVFLGLARI